MKFIPYNYARLIRPDNEREANDPDNEVVNSKQTNEHVVRTLMNHSNAGALIQAFVIDALEQMADKVISQRIELLEEEADSGKTSFISTRAWIQCAVDTKAAITTQRGQEWKGPEWTD